jgi:hypothetical protein
MRNGEWYEERDSPTPSRRRREIFQGEGATQADIRPMRIEARRAFSAAYRRARLWLDRLIADRFCASSSAKGGHGLAGLCGLAEVGFLVLPEVVHIEVAMGFEPILVGFDC